MRIENYSKAHSRSLTPNPTSITSTKKICDGAVTVFQTKHSGGIWHMRAYLASETKYFQKSLRTKDKASAIDNATYENARLLVLKDEGKAVFSPTVYKAVEMYIKYRYDTDMLMQRITGGVGALLRHT